MDVEVVEVLGLHVDQRVEHAVRRPYPEVEAEGVKQGAAHRHGVVVMLHDAEAKLPDFVKHIGGETARAR